MTKMMLVARSVVVFLIAFSCGRGLADEDARPQRPDPAKRDWFGQFYDLKEYAKCVERTNDPRNTQCEYLRLTRVDEPEYWPYANVPKPKLPAVSEKTVYRRGMTGRQYFEALCKAEAGEFIYKTVEDVEGLYQIRPRKVASQEALMDRYVMEDPYGYTNFEATEPGFVFVNDGRYRFLEVPAAAASKPRTASKFRDESLFKDPPADAKVVRYFGYDGRDMRTLKRVSSADPEARYGYTWRGISRPNDRKLGIAGGELAVVDLHTGELLGVRRGFILSGNVRQSRSGIQWESGAVCPADAASPGLHKDDHFPFSFVSKVLKPSRIARPTSSALLLKR